MLFSTMMSSNCEGFLFCTTGQSEDYETWVPHETLRKEENKNVEGCLLGQKEVFQRVKKDSWYMKLRYEKDICSVT